MDHFGIRHFAVDGHYMVAPAGELDLAAAPALETVLHEYDAQSSDGVIVDLGAVTFLDSAGLSFLAKLHRRTAARGATLRLLNTSPKVTRLLRIVGLDPLLAS